MKSGSWGLLWGIAASFVLSSVTAAAEISLESIQGNWSITKTNREGSRFYQIMEINRDKLIFRILDADKQPRFMAKGTVKVEKAGPFHSLTIASIEAGRREDDLQPVEDSRTAVITLREDHLVMASNFDKVRENEPPGVEVYKRGEATSAQNIDSLLGTWKLQIELTDNTLDYQLMVKKTDGKLALTLVSPRTGEYPAKNVNYEPKSGDLYFEVNRVIDGNPATFIFKGKVIKDEISGPFSVKEVSEVSGKWKATK